jgi:hypothetical protein
LGLVLLEAATGRREYPGEGHDAAAARLTNPPAVPRNLPDPLRHALVAMTDIDPARRPTARQVNDMLAGGFTEDEQPEPEQRGRTWVWVLALLTLLAVLAAIVLLNSGSRQQPVVPTTPPTTAENTGDGNNAPALPDVPTFQAPQLPELPQIPDIPSMPNLPELPNLPTVPDSVSNDAQSLWQQFTDWLSERVDRSVELQWKLDDDRRPLPGPAGDPDRPAKGLDPVAQADQAGAGRRIGATSAVVADREVQEGVALFEGDVGV